MSTLRTTRSGMSVSGRNGSALARVVSMIELAVERRRSRKALLEMSESQLKDIGLSRSEAYAEGSRSFWS